ncbi:hypothetical protein [Mesorhizobium sp. M7A.F.Ca.MR.362.00.0.0]|uniref:hypothetical protein n=1 Tax=Mesorhizobium sp. M7A.F.Ca.MR.362.00.0.0 TaxID=2496779 RepID=UPI000FD38146|nr:hypothetical protein [Mesorhizobium sp. M7A.F.Ca.MR.362.00.0.0]RUU80238.1 hypothetical protein EOC06_12960 [Mesorhizobium sp. M7A.F.Ca.MR.362.00.0.0]RWN95147.1 MAG: hypothetical protein EOS05_10125 [Mesorhizobium sp.]
MSREYESRDWTGRDPDSKYPSVTELIDKYLPRHTREEVVAMSMAYEDRIRDLMYRIHEYHLRCDAMSKHMHSMEEEYYQHTRIPISLGAFKADAFVDIASPDMAKTYQVTWRPDTYRAQLRLAYRPVSKDEHPHLFEATMRQFEQEITRTLIPKLRHEFAKLYATENYR